VDGPYIWKFITTLDYELRVIRGRQPYRWTIWIYSLARFAALMAVIIDLVFLNVTTQMGCQVGCRNKSTRIWKRVDLKMDE